MAIGISRTALFHSCDWGPAAASNDGVTRSEMMPTLCLGLQNIASLGFAIAGGTRRNPGVKCPIEVQW